MIGFMAGSVDDVRIYNRALSSDEVAQLYAIEATPPPGFETNGLVAYYPFNGNANDESVNTNNGTVFGATLTTDRFGDQGKAIAFNGTNQYVEAPHQPYLTFPAGDFTVGFWAVVNDLSRIQFMVGKDMGQGIQNKWIVQYSPGPEVQYLGFGFCINGPVYAFADVKPRAGTWHYFQFRKSGTHYSVHLDGAAVSGEEGVSSLRSDNTAPLTIGWAEGSAYFKGKLDDIRIYDRALMDSEVQQLYLLEAPPLLNLKKAVYLDCPNLKVGTNYQLQVSSDLGDWTNYGTPFTATNSMWRSTDYWDVDDWNSLYFRFQVSP